MFNMIGSLAKAVVGVVVQTPVAIVADAVTMGGLLTDKKQSYTASALGQVQKNIEKSVK